MVKEASYIFIFIIALTAFPPANAACTDGSGKVVLYFANGMLNDREDAEASLKSLKDRGHQKYAAYEVAFNTNENLLSQLLQVYEQKMGSEKRFLWSFFSELAGPSWFNEVIKNKIRDSLSIEYLKDFDLQIQIADYIDYMHVGFKVVVVAHSQGNFYANRSYEIMAQNDPNLNEKLRVVGVASPDNDIYAPGDYRTLESDYIIRSIPGALPYNISNQSKGRWDHQFIQHYLDGVISGPSILELISENTLDLNDTNFFKMGYVNKELEEMDKWVKIFSKNPDAYRLNRPQCLAIALFLKLENYSGMSCEERNLDLIKREAEECLTFEWSNPDKGVFNCQLNGLDGFGAIQGMNGHELILLAEQEECYWDASTIHKQMSRAVLEQAYSIIQSPKKYFK